MFYENLFPRFMFITSTGRYRKDALAWIEQKVISGIMYWDNRVISIGDRYYMIEAPTIIVVKNKKKVRTFIVLIHELCHYVIFLFGNNRQLQKLFDKIYSKIRKATHYVL